MEEPRTGSTEGSENGVFLKGARSEIAIQPVGIQLSRVHGHDRPHEIRPVGRAAAGERVVSSALVDEDRETSGEAAYTRDVPTLRQALRQGAKSPVERNGPVVAHHEIV